MEAAADFKSDLLLDVDALREQLAPLAKKIEEKRESQSLEIVAFGAISSGKSSLLNALAGRDVFRTDPRGGTTVQRNEIPWPGVDKVLLVDTPGLGEIDGAERGSLSAAAANRQTPLAHSTTGRLERSSASARSTAISWGSPIKRFKPPSAMSVLLPFQVCM